MSARTLDPAIEPTLALSVRQPWAWLIVHGYKPVENRDWRTSYRGPLFMHASKTFDDNGYAWVRTHFPHIPLADVDWFERGGIVGRVMLTDCVTVHPSKFFRGPYGHVYERPIATPFMACRGMPGFFRPALAP